MTYDKDLAGSYLDKLRDEICESRDVCVGCPAHIPWNKEYETSCMFNILLKRIYDQH